MRTLAEAPDLHTLELIIADHSQLGNNGAAAVGQVSRSPRLSTISITAKNQTPTLKKVTLDLHGNHVQESGARALASFIQSPSIHHLGLGLGANSIGDWAAPALGAQNLSNPLQVLALNLDSNNLTDRGLTWLCGHWSAGAYKILKLSLADNLITDVGACGLGALRMSATLQDAHIEAELPYGVS